MPLTLSTESLRNRVFGLKALIADFDSTSLEILSSYLKEAGMEVIMAKDGLTALELFRNQKPQIVFLEAMLPKMSGFELSQQIYIETQGKVPVIIITGIYKDSRHKMEAIQTYKAAAFLTKPWQREEMAKAILDVLGPAVKPPVDEEELMLESLEELSPIIKEIPPLKVIEPSSFSASPSKEKMTKKPIASGDEIDKLLEKTLADLGFDGRKKLSPEQKKEEPQKIFKEPLPIKTALPSESKLKGPELKPVEPLKPKPSIEETHIAEKQVIETEIKKSPFSVITEKEKIIDTEKQPFASAVDLGKKVAEELKTKSYEQSIKQTVMEEEVEKVGSPDRPSVYLGYFETEHEGKKRSPAYILFGVTGAIALTLLGIFFFKPKKTELPIPQQAVAETQKVTADISTSDISQNISSRIEEQATVAKPVPGEDAVRKQINKLASILPLNKEEPPEEEPLPILATESSSAPLALPANPTPIKTEKEFSSVQATEVKEQETKAEPKIESQSLNINEGDLVPISQVDIQPRPVKIVEPKYPELAKQMGLEGIVVVNALISEKGDVIKTEILRGIKNGSSLEQAAEAAVRQWKFTPAVKNGLKVKVWKPIEIRFRLRK